MDDHRHLVRCRGIAPAGASTNLKYVLTPDPTPGNHSVRVWNLSTKVNAPQGYITCTVRHDAFGVSCASLHSNTPTSYLLITL